MELSEISSSKPCDRAEKTLCTTPLPTYNFRSADAVVVVVELNMLKFSLFGALPDRSIPLCAVHGADFNSDRFDMKVLSKMGPLSERKYYQREKQWMVLKSY